MTKSYPWQWLWLPNGYLDVSRELLSTIDVVVWWNPFTWIIWMYVRWSYVYYQPRAILLCFCWCGLTFSTLLMHMHVGHPMTLQTIVQLFVWAIIGSPELVFVFWRNFEIQKCARLVVQNNLWYVHVVSLNHWNWSFRQRQNIGKYGIQSCLYRKVNSWLKSSFKIG